MDFVPLIDRFGEPATAALIGLALGLGFGFLAERTGFCTRSAALEISNGRRGNMLPIWLIAFATTVLLTQGLIAWDLLSVRDTRFFGTAQSLSGAVIGGGLFGVGMVLARGCASRLLVLGVSGNLRALFSIAIIAATAWATYQGPLVSIRNAAASLLMTSSIGTNELAVALNTGTGTGLAVGAALAVLALGVAFARRLRIRHLLGGLAIGALIPAGWYLTYQYSLQVFEPVQADSLSYMRPLANTLNYVGSGGSESFLSTDVGLIAGTVIGALVASLAFGSFRIRTFAEAGAPHWLRYVAGSVLMGFGGILAVGCTVGAGFTGGAVLAVSALIALASMVLSAMLADKVIDGNRHPAASPVPIAVPAE